MRVVVLGPPGSGKGTQARLLASRLGVVHLSVGAALRAEVAGGSRLGARIAAEVAAGDLVATADVLAIVEDRLTFRITYRSRRSRVTVTSATATYELLDGAPIDISHYGAPVALDGTAVGLPIPAALEATAPSQPAGRAPARRTVRRQRT